MYASLPKNRWGNLDPSVVRYALHRFFVQKHGWYMRGLDPNGAAWHAESANSILTDRAPAYIQSVFEQRLRGRGMTLADLAVFAAAMSDLVHKEASKDMHNVYSAMRLPTVGAVPRFWAEGAVKGYMMGYLIGGNITAANLEELQIIEKELVDIYPDWDNTYTWVKDFRETHDLEQLSGSNPFVQKHDSFDGEVKFVQELGHHFGSFQDLECKALKNRLVDLEHQGTGRILLSSFYAGGLSGDWTLTESVDYLRNLGVLDESDPKRPTVVISNYITSHTNCLTASGFYSVCCFDDCEGLLRHLEQKIAAPDANPERIAELVSELPSDTIDAPRNLSSALLTRLNEIAKHHSGQIPLHGRLFAQWMHHAYPRECPFPHAAGTKNPMAPDEWMAHHGVDNVEATMEEMQWHHAQRESADLDAEIELPWTEVEELVSGEEPVYGERWWTRLRGSLRALMAFVLLASSALGLMRAAKVAFAPGAGASLPKHEQVLV